MDPSQGIAACTDPLAADCGFDTASMFFCDRTGGTANIPYLHHVNVSTAAQHSYVDHRAFLSQHDMNVVGALVAQISRQSTH